MWALATLCSKREILVCSTKCVKTLTNAVFQKFDLKGSMRNRLVNTAGRQTEEELVLLDENLLKCKFGSSVLDFAPVSDSSLFLMGAVFEYFFGIISV